MKTNYRDIVFGNISSVNELPTVTATALKNSASEVVERVQREGRWPLPATTSLAR